MSGKYKSRLIIEHIFAYLYVQLSWYKWDRSKQFRMENSTGFDAKHLNSDLVNLIKITDLCKKKTEFNEDEVKFQNIQEICRIFLLFCFWKQFVKWTNSHQKSFSSICLCCKIEQLQIGFWSFLQGSKNCQKNPVNR